LGEDRVMRIINIDFFKRHPDEFYSFYRQYFSFPAVEPSQAHYILADLEKNRFIKGIVTQNIDNLHQKAGSKNVIPIHGNAEQFICTARHCRHLFDSQYVQDYPDTVPRCSICGSIVKPNVVLFGENINNYMGARDLIVNARLLIVIGSSLTVYPLAGFVKEFSTFTQDLVIINKGATHMDHAALVKVDTTGSSTGEILSSIKAGLGIQ
jgi:NAD-dependent deacetylase